MKALNFIKEYYLPIIASLVVAAAVVIAIVEISAGHYTSAGF